MNTIGEWTEARGITCEIVKDRGAQVENGWEHHAYVVKLTDPTTGRSIETPWKQGFGIKTSPTDTPAEILDSLIQDAWSIEDAGDFDHWAEDLGCDTDSRKAYELWLAVKDTVPSVREFFGDEFEAVAGLERL